MIIEALTISRLLERIIRKELHKTKAVENYRRAVKTLPHRIQVKVSNVFSSYVLRYLVDKYFMYFV